MAVPFRRVSKTRKRMHRTHYKVFANGTTKCTNCGAIIRPHRVCNVCGFYKGANVLEKAKPEVETTTIKKVTKKEPTKKIVTKKETIKKAPIQKVVTKSARKTPAK